MKHGSVAIILDSSVGRARVCDRKTVWQGATTQQGRPWKGEFERAPRLKRREEQRSQAGFRAYNRVRSGLAFRVNFPEDTNFRSGAAFMASTKRSTEESRIIGFGRLCCFPSSAWETQHKKLCFPTGSVRSRPRHKNKREAGASGLRIPKQSLGTSDLVWFRFCRLRIIGFGRLGRARVAAIRAGEQLVLAGIVGRPEGTAAEVGHEHLLLRARFSEVALSAQCMTAARALPSRKAGGYTPFGLPPGALWGQLRAPAEREWL
jgi:hypothetical protein